MERARDGSGGCKTYLVDIADLQQRVVCVSSVQGTDMWMCVVGCCSTRGGRTGLELVNGCKDLPLATVTQAGTDKVEGKAGLYCRREGYMCEGSMYDLPVRIPADGGSFQRARRRDEGVGGDCERGHGRTAARAATGRALGRTAWWAKGATRVRGGRRAAAGGDDTRACCPSRQVSHASLPPCVTVLIYPRRQRVRVLLWVL